MDYPATLDYLETVQERGIKLGLQTMQALLALLGHPERDLPSISVAGTNGKGSVCAFLDSILRAGGVRTGLYTSPHLVRYEERIMVKGRPILPDDLAFAISEVRERIEAGLHAGALPSHPTHFEVITAAALWHFRRTRVEAAVLEVGLGGRLDAVAAAGSPVAVITHVGLEHTRHLGDTVEAIAFEKAGIIGERCRVALTAERQAGPLARIREAAAARGARLIEVAPGAEEELPELLLAGAHQRRNAALAARTAGVLHEAGVTATPVSRQAVLSGLTGARWPGRLQVVARRPLVVLDGAHNPDGCVALARWLEGGLEPELRRRLCLIFGALEDKQVEPMARALFPLAGRVVLTRGRSGRFREPSDLAAVAEALAPGRVIVEPDLIRALDEARGWAGAGGAVCLCGSLYLVGDALQALGIDPYDMVASASAPSSDR